MELLWKIFTLLFLVQGTFSVRVTLENSQTGIVPKTKERNTNVVFPCSATASASAGGTPSLEWTYSTDPTKEGTHVYYGGTVTPGLDRVSIQNPYSLAITGLVSSDSGYYKCRVVIPGDTPSADAATYNFTVLVPPYEQISCGFPGDLMLTLGTSAEFRCQEVVAQAVPAPTYKWFKNNQELPLTSSGNALYSNSSFSYSTTTGILKFSTVTASDKGEYYCTASNGVGTPQSCSKATIKTKETNVGAIVGIVFGVIFLLIIIGVLVWWTWRKGYCDSFFEGKDHDDEIPDDGANDVMLDGAGPVVTKEPSEWSNGNSHRDSTHSSGPRMPEGAVRVMP